MYNRAANQPPPPLGFSIDIILLLCVCVCVCVYTVRAENISDPIYDPTAVH